MSLGYMGKILWVDLTRKEFKDEVLEERFCREYVGGYGIGAKLLFDRLPAGADPLGPENMLGFMMGPLTGTAALGASRYTVVGKSPITGGWGDANSGGDFGPYFKWAGYDGVFFTGISDSPVYLLIDDGKVELKDASHLWGKDTFDTEDILKAQFGRGTEVASIGPAGEKVSLIAAIMNNKGRAAARSGLGAVMGSKRLKAVVVRGNQKVPQADEQKVKDLRKKNLKEMGGAFPMLRDIGTPSIFNVLAAAGDTPTKNWTSAALADFPTYKEIGAGPIMEKQARKYGCYRCPIACGGHMKAGTGQYEYPEGAHKPEYETLGMFGSNCLNDNLDSIILVGDICNRYGLDTISAGSCMSFAIECYERGIITKEDTDGIELTWGNHRSIVAMTEKLVRREGFGDLLADGVKRAAEKIGKGSEEFAIHIAGQEVGAHDPRHGLQWGIAYRMDPTPARHTQGGTHVAPGLLPEFDKDSVVGRALPHMIGSNYSHMTNSLGLCQFVVMCYDNASVILDFLNAVTGWNMDMDEFLKTGERIADIRQAFNCREGLNALSFKLSTRLTGNPTPREKGPLAGKVLNEKTLLGDYCKLMGWDMETSKPTRERLLALGMDEVARVLWP
jgi:aldehyde:ferredoxin oxidoreductase